MNSLYYIGCTLIPLLEAKLGSKGGEVQEWVYGSASHVDTKGRRNEPLMGNFQSKKLKDALNKGRPH